MSAICPRCHKTFKNLKGVHVHKTKVHDPEDQRKAVIFLAIVIPLMTLLAWLFAYLADTGFFYK